MRIGPSRAERLKTPAERRIDALMEWSAHLKMKSDTAQRKADKLRKRYLEIDCLIRCLRKESP